MAKLPRAVLTAIATIWSSGSVAQWYQGPSGGQGGSAFDTWAESNNARDIDGIGTVDDGAVHCLVVTYRDVPPDLATKFRYGSCSTDPGQPGFQHFDSFGMDADEYIVGVTGTYGDHINSFSFYTNKGDSKTWGTPGPHSFGYSAPSGQMIVAFTGRAGARLDSLGVMYAPCPPATKQCR